MKILIFSDSHGNSKYMQCAVDIHPDAEYVIHLGDGVADGAYLALSAKTVFIGVCGNCDFFSSAPGELFEKFGGVGTLITHGHKYNVKSSMAVYEKYAESQGAKVALYGHTHHKDITYKNGIYFFNPGSIGKFSLDGYTYGIMTVKNGEVLLSHGKIGNI